MSKLITCIWLANNNGEKAAMHSIVASCLY